MVQYNEIYMVEYWTCKDIPFLPLTTTNFCKIEYEGIGIFQSKPASIDFIFNDGK